MRKFFGGKLGILVFAVPTLLLYTLFVIFPLFPAITISLSKHNGFSNLGFVGLSNYKEILTSGIFWLVDKNTFFIVLAEVLIGLPISLILALILDTLSSGSRRFFKSAAFIPAVISISVVSQMWLAIYEPNWGLLNSILKLLGMEPKAWIGDSSTVLGSIAVAFIWQYIGMNMLILYTGLKSIPKTYYEAALIDGANFVQTQIKITIPLMREIIKYVLIIASLGSMGLFGHVQIMSGGGPGDASRTIVYQLWNYSVKELDYGKACAISIIFIIECLIIFFIINKTVAKEKIQF